MAPELTESKKLKYSYPYGLGTFLMSGCYQYTGMPEKKFERTNENDQDDNENESDNDENESISNKRKRKRQIALNRNETDEFISFCNRYAKAQQSLECEKMIPGAYTLGTGFDIKYENGENARRKSVIVRYCNYQK